MMIVTNYLKFLLYSSYDIKIGHLEPDNPIQNDRGGIASSRNIKTVTINEYFFIDSYPIDTIYYENRNKTRNNLSVRLSFDMIQINFKENRIGPKKIIFHEVQLDALEKTLCGVKFEAMVTVWLDEEGYRIPSRIVKEFILNRRLRVSYTDPEKFFQNPIDEMIYLTEFPDYMKGYYNKLP